MKTWQFIVNKFSAKINLVLLYVLHSEGSSPGRQGFKMAVAADGSFCGSIGGGIMEHKFVEMAKAKMAGNTAAKDVYLQMHDKEAGSDKSGMICSGEQSIFLYELLKQDIGFISQLIDSLQNNEHGSLILSNNGIVFSAAIPETDCSFTQNQDGSFLLVEKTGFKNTLHIVGGGHCALALSRLMSSMDFYIHLYEDRESLNTLEQNIYVHEKHIVYGYDALGEIVKSGNNVYVVIMTFGYRTDDTALRALIHHNFRYIGMLASGTKKEKMFAGYNLENIDSLLFQKIHSPIGLSIKSQTPEEIAVSIAAEIIAEKNKDQ